MSTKKPRKLTSWYDDVHSADRTRCRHRSPPRTNASSATLGPYMLAVHNLARRRAYSADPGSRPPHAAVSCLTHRSVTYYPHVALLVVPLCHGVMSQHVFTIADDMHHPSPMLLCPATSALLQRSHVAPDTTAMGTPRGTWYASHALPHR